MSRQTIPRNLRVLAFPLPGGNYAELQVPVDMSTAEVEALCNQIDAVRPVLMVQARQREGVPFTRIAPCEGGS